MSTSITPFSFDGMAVRAVQVDGDTWFVAADVCAILDLGNVTMALKRLDHDEQALISVEGFSCGNDRVAYQARISSGHLEHKVTTGERSDGTEWTSTQVRITAKGLARLSTVVGQDATENIAISA